MQWVWVNGYMEALFMEVICQKEVNIMLAMKSLFMYTSFCPVVIFLQIQCFDFDSRVWFSNCFPTCKKITLALKVSNVEGKPRGTVFTALTINYYNKSTHFWVFKRCIRLARLTTFLIKKKMFKKSSENVRNRFQNFFLSHSEGKRRYLSKIIWMINILWHTKEENFCHPLKSK